MTQDRYVTFGNDLYKATRPFVRWPKRLKLGWFSKGSVDSHGNLYVCQRADPPVLVVDRFGEYVRSIGDGREVDSHGICITKDDRVLLVDRDAHQVLCYSPKGELLFTIGSPTKPRFGAPFSHPTDVIEGPDGDIYVADGYGNNLVHRFSADGKLKKSWGGYGKGPGQFSTPHGIAFLSDGRLVVGDRENNRIQVFDPDGAYLTEWDGSFHPMDILAGSDGLIYVTNQCPGIVALDSHGKRIGACKPPIAMPHGITGDKEGNIYIIEPRLVSDITKLAPVRQ